MVRRKYQEMAGDGRRLYGRRSRRQVDPTAAALPRWLYHLRGGGNPVAWLLSLVLVAGWLAAVPAARAGLPLPYGGRVVVGQLGRLFLTTPGKAETFDQLLLARQLHETLVRAYADGTLVPVLLEQLPQASASGREWTINLRPGLVDQTGNALTSADVVASWERLLSSETDSPHWWLLAMVEGASDFRAGRATKVRGLQVVNRLQLLVRLRLALPEFLEVLAAVPLAPLAARFLAPGKTGPLPGSGPFLLKTAGAGQAQVTLAPFLRHSLGRPLPDLLTWKTYDDEHAARLDMKLGRLDVLLGRDLTGLGFSVQESVPGWPIVLVVNNKRLDDLPEGFMSVLERVIERKSLVHYAVGKWGRVLTGLLATQGDQAPAAGPVKNTDVSDFSRRMAMRKTGTPPVLIFLVRRGATVERRIAEKIQVGLLKAGIAVSLLELDGRQLRSKCRAGEYHLVLARPFIPCRNESMRLLGMLAAINWLTGSDLSLKMMEDLLVRVSRMNPDRQRRAVVREMARTFQRRLPVLPLLVQNHGLSMGQGIANQKLLQSGLVDFAYTWRTR